MDCLRPESYYYCDFVRPLEYQTILTICSENLHLRNFVIMVAPLIVQIQDYTLWEELVRNSGVSLDEVRVRFVWVEHDIDLEHERIIQRNAPRDAYKLSHWEEYARGLDGIKPDPRYDAFVYRNSEVEEDMDRLVKWATE